MRIVLEYALIFIFVAMIVALVPQIISVVVDSWYKAVKHVAKTIKENNDKGDNI